MSQRRRRLHCKPLKQIPAERSIAGRLLTAKATDLDIAACGRKIRYERKADARLAGESQIQSGCADELFVYRCPACLGFHLTRTANSTPVLAGPRTPHGEVLTVIRTGDVKSYFGSAANTPEHQWIHNVCLQLEQDGKIERKRQDEGAIVWRIARPRNHTGAERSLP